MFTARYGLMPYVTQIRFVFKGLISLVCTTEVESIYSAVRNDALYNAYVSPLKG